MIIHSFIVFFIKHFVINHAGINRTELDQRNQDPAGYYVDKNGQTKRVGVFLSLLFVTRKRLNSQVTVRIKEHSYLSIINLLLDSYFAIVGSLLVNFKTLKNANSS